MSDAFVTCADINCVLPCFEVHQIYQRNFHALVEFQSFYQRVHSVHSYKKINSSIGSYTLTPLTLII